jgi:hypothetical protein
MSEKRKVWLPILLMVVFAITRWPGLMPPNFSTAYALVFCAGVYFRHRLAWWVPILILIATDLALNVYYTWFAQERFNAFQWYQLINYVAYGGIFLIGRRFKPQARIASLVCGGLCGGILFYVLTNSAAWFFNPFENQEYDRSIATWLLALVKGASSWPDAWLFFRNTLFSAGLFTGLFAAAMKYSEHLESAAEKKAAEATEDTEETQPEQA